jgi:hypothetical protein
VNIFEIRDVKELIKLDISTQEKIRLIYRLGFKRNQIAKILNIKYQVVFKATNPKYAPLRWEKVLTHLLKVERENSTVKVEEVKLI